MLVVTWIMVGLVFISALVTLLWSLKSTSKYRVFVNKSYLSRELYYPQYKGWFLWHNIGQHEFSGTIMCKAGGNDFGSKNNYVYHMSTAKTVIKEFKAYLESCSSYTFVEEVD